METTSFDALFKSIRIKFLFHHPFLSVISLSLPIIYRENPHSVFETDGIHILIDAEKLKEYSQEEITYLYAHTLLHVILKHPYRMRDRDPFIWNLSADIVVNLLLKSFKNVGKRPPEEILDEDLVDKSVEEVYEILYKEEKKGQKIDLIQAKESQNEEKLDALLAQALAVAKKESRIYESLMQEVTTLKRPDIPLHDLLKEFLTTAFFEKTLTYSRPNRRFLTQGLYMPGMQKESSFLRLYIAVDASMSIDEKEFSLFLGTIKEVAQNAYEFELTVLPFDDTLRKESILKLDNFSDIHADRFYLPKSNGGTDFSVVLKYLHNENPPKDALLIVLSDGEFTLNQKPPIQTLFLLTQAKKLERFKKYGKTMWMSR